jgi:hypothetical protein
MYAGKNRCSMRSRATLADISLDRPSGLTQLRAAHIWMEMALLVVHREMTCRMMSSSASVNNLPQYLTGASDTVVMTQGYNKLEVVSI